MTSTGVDLLSQAKKMSAQLVQMRRHIHANPELSFKENQTGTYAAGILKELGYKVTEKVGGTGVLAELGEGPFVGIRADMDALPIQETTGAAYASKNSGVMHACGHDAHTACALGAAKLLAQARKEGDFKGSVRFLFQPAEEMVDEKGQSGAGLLIQGGALKDLRALVGLHVWPGLPAGSIAIKKGHFLAACDSFTVTIKGKGGHGAYPDATIDPIVISALVVQSIQTVMSRRKSALDPAVLTIGGIRSSSFRPNIVPDNVELIGTVRYFEPKLSAFFEKEVRAACEIARVYGADFDLVWRSENPVLTNDEELSDLVVEAGGSILGRDRVIIHNAVELGAEDFAFYTALVPSCFVALGTQIEGQQIEFHNPNFDINEDALPVGSALLAASALEMAKKYL